MEQTDEQRKVLTLVERVLMEGDLKSLTTEQRLFYYRTVCESLGLNHLTRPFEYITVNGKMILYARRDATDQLRRRHGISIEIIAREKIDDVMVVRARATAPDGRTDESIGAVSLTALRGDALANAYMKAETKAKRRVTLSIVGLGWMDETEAETLTQNLPMLEAPKKKKFSEMSSDEQLTFTQETWKERRRKLAQTVESPLPMSLQEMPLEKAMAATKLLGEALAKSGDELGEILGALAELLELSPQTEGEKDVEH